MPLTQVSGGGLADNSVNAAKIATGAVTVADIPDGEISHVKLAADAVDGDNIADDSINSEHYVDGSIDHAHLANDCVDGDNIADDVVLGGNPTTTTQSASNNSTRIATTAYVDTAVGNLSQDSITEGNTKAEVVDTGSDGHFKVETEGSERVRIGNSGQIGLSGTNYGQSGEVLTSQGASSAPTWTSVSPQNSCKKWANEWYNDYAFSFSGLNNPIPSWMPNGRGYLQPNTGMSGTPEAEHGGYIEQSGRIVTWGVAPQEILTGVATDQSTAGNVHWNRFVARQSEIFMRRAYEGDSNYAKWLNDWQGNSLGYSSDIMYARFEKMCLGHQAGYALTDNGMLYYWGENTYGNYGTGFTTSYQIPKRVYLCDSSENFLSNATQPQIRFAFFNGNSHTNTTTYNFYAITAAGDLYASGYGPYGNLPISGGNQTTKYKMLPCDMSLFNNEKIAFVTGSPQNTYYLTVEGKVYSTGVNSYGEACNGTTGEISTPFEITGDSNNSIHNKKIVHIQHVYDSSFWCTYFLDSDGVMHGSGRFEHFGLRTGVHQPGTSTGYLRNTAQFTNMSNITGTDSQKVVAFWCTEERYVSIFMLTDGGTTNKPKVYATGSNEFGKLGVGIANDLDSGSLTDATGHGYCEEIKFEYPEIDEAGEMETTSITGTQYSTTIQNEYPPGRIIDFSISGGHGQGVAHGHILTDDKGMAWFAGHGEGLMSFYNNEDEATGNAGSSGYTSGSYQFFTCVPELPCAKPTRVFNYSPYESANSYYCCSDGKDTWVRAFTTNNKISGTMTYYYPAKCNGNIAWKKVMTYDNAEEWNNES